VITADNLHNAADKAGAFTKENWAELDAVDQFLQESNFHPPIDLPALAFGILIGMVVIRDNEQGRLLRAAAAALERTQVDDAGEATMILEQVVTLNGEYVPKPDNNNDKE
jgi:hypothetical protein